MCSATSSRFGERIWDLTRSVAFLGLENKGGRAGGGGGAAGGREGGGVDGKGGEGTDRNWVRDKVNGGCGGLGSSELAKRLEVIVVE